MVVRGLSFRIFGHVCLYSDEAVLVLRYPCRATLLDGRQRLVITRPAHDKSFVAAEICGSTLSWQLLLWLQETENTVGRLWGVAAVADAMRDLKSAAQGDSGQEGTWRDLGARKHIRGEQKRK
jgi:hypothetical protein